MFNQVLENGIIKQVCYSLLILQMFSSIGVCRSYSTFLFFQLDLKGSTITLNNDEKSWIASSLGFLSPIGSLIGGSLAHTLGRKMSMPFMFIPFLVAWIITAFSTNYTMLLIGGVARGMGLGMVMCLITYAAEISSTKLRGLLLSLVDVAFNFGSFICTVLMKYLAWDTVSLIFVAFNVFNLISVIILPESPVWLYSKGKPEKAINTLCSLRNSTPERLVNEIEEMAKSCTTESKDTNACKTVLHICDAWKQLFISCFFIILIMNAGHYVIQSYQIEFIDWLKVPFDSTNIALYLSLVGFIGSFLTPLFVHTFSRKASLAISSLGMGISMAAVALYEEIFLQTPDKPLALIVPVALCAFVFFTNLAVIPLSFIIGGELFPVEGRGVIQGIWAGFSCAYYSLAVKVYPYLISSHGIKFNLWSFAMHSFGITIFAVFVLPETRGKSLQEIQDQYFRKSKRTSNIGKESLKS